MVYGLIVFLAILVIIQYLLLKFNTLKMFKSLIIFLDIVAIIYSYSIPRINILKRFKDILKYFEKK